MKKIFFLALLATGLFTITAKAQTAALKVGIFDFDQVVQAMPGYGKVDTAVALYERDSLGAEYQFYQEEYQRLDSSFKSDSAKGRAQSVLNTLLQQKQQVAMNLVYWQQIAQQKSQQKRQQLAAPLMIQVNNAYKKVLAATKVTLVLKPGAIEYGTDDKAVVNLIILVAKELNLPVQGQPAASTDTNSGVKKPTPSVAPKKTKP